MQALQHNWQVKLVSLVLAVVVHVYVRRQQDVARTVFPLPITIEAQGGQRVVEPRPNFRVNVELEGPAEFIRAIRSDEIQLGFDLSDVKPGTPRDVPVTVNLPDKYRNRLMVDWRPRTIHVLVVSDASRQFPVLVKRRSRPTGWEINEALSAAPPLVTVSGTAEAVVRVGTVVAELDLEALPRINALVALRALDSEARDITEQVRLDPVQVTVTGTQQRVVLQKRVPVQPSFRVPPGMRVVSVVVVPWKVRVIGEESVIGDVYVAETGPIAIPPGQTQVNAEAILVPPKPGMEVLPLRVQVQIRLQPLNARPGSLAPRR